MFLTDLKLGIAIEMTCNVKKNKNKNITCVKVLQKIQISEMLINKDTFKEWKMEYLF